MQKTLRAFVAVPIPDAVAVFLQQIQVRLQSPGMNVRWVATKNIHLTLKFLGDIDPSRVPAVAAQMDTAAGSVPSFSLEAMGVGVFPNLRNARVLWVGLGGDLDRLRAIQTTLESDLESVGFRKETRRFHPHLTIGRTRQRVDAETIGASLEPLKDVASDSFRVDRLMLFNSILKPAGAEHTLLHTSRLAI
ncbi:MAG: RNA 2',3'-cyclic phosphodiesterase [Desulfosarcina sp.]|nr:RNA 2',3'-cyclic phosphodiesterase [Desulfosarcina sp.]MBC2744610.1 RNA 2',3'-cyclic phosphodiesterase [Desulfosarcina sp.]MBC2767519.1 RNA 2',3'-cyclic phosphodiesterase [Desulfosarcina sp.]